MKTKTHYHLSVSGRLTKTEQGKIARFTNKDAAARAQRNADPQGNRASWVQGCRREW